MFNLHDYAPKLSYFTRGKMDEKKIEVYWKQLCNQEKTSKTRNKALLDDFERVEHQSDVLDAQTKKLTMLRDRYEGYINTMYPRWLDELKHYKKQLTAERNRQPGEGAHYPAVGKADRRPENNVRFASPTYMEQEEIGYPDQSYFDQSSIPHYRSTRLKTLDWDNYYRDPSLDYYHMRQVPPMGTPNSHFAYQPHPDYMRFSTPYNPGHSGPFNPTNSFSQSFDITHPSPGYEATQRQTNMAVPMRYTLSKDMQQPNMGHHIRLTSPSRAMDDHERVPYNNNPRQEILQPEKSAGLTYQEPRLRQNTQFRHAGPDSSHNDFANRLSPSQLNGVGSLLSEPTSPYTRDPPEKPLEGTTHPVDKTTENSSSTTPEKLVNQKQPLSPHKVPSDTETPHKLEREDLLSGNSICSSPLDLSDLQTRESDANPQGRQETLSPRDRADNKVETKPSAESPLESLKEKLQERNDGDDLLDVISDGLSLSSEDICEDECSLDGKDNTGPAKMTVEAVQNYPRDAQKENQNIPLDKSHNEPSVDVKLHIVDKSAGRPEEVATPSTIQPTTDATAMQDKKPFVSIDVFLTLLNVVDADIDVSFSPETLYHSPRCSQTMKEDIIMRAKNGDNLEMYDPSSISMIIQEELPRLTRSSPSKGLIKTTAMETIINQPSQVRDESIEPSLVFLWHALLSHMVRLVVHNVMAVDQVTELFAVLLLESNSPYASKFQVILAGLIKEAINKGDGDDGGLQLTKNNHQQTPLDNRSVASEESSTLGSTPPQSANQHDLPNEDSQGTPASLQRTLSYEDDFEEEEDIPLTETAAYKKMMSSAQSNHSDTDNQRDNAAKNQEQDSEEDDDLERTLARNISPPLPSPRQRSPLATKPMEKKKPGRQKPKLSIFSNGGDGGEDLADSWGAEDAGILSSSWKSEKSDITNKTESPPSSPDLDTGYVPTAMEQKKEPGKVDTAVPKAAARKPGFWNHSDTESEVDLQLSTGVVDDEDDFDFYG